MPGFMGHDLENVNRWRGAVGLAPVTEAELSKLAQAVQIGGEEGQLYDQAGENPGSGEKTRMLVAIARHQGIAWFFKLNGDDELVAQQKPAFVDFLKTVSFESAPGQTDLPPSHPPIGGSDALPSQPMLSQASDQTKPNWQVPTGWKELPGGPFLVSKFSIGAEDTPPTTVNVSMSQGEGGGLVMNVNRWRGQIGLSPLPEAEISKALTSLDTAGGKAMFIDLAGTDPKSGQKARIVGAIVSQPNRTWFYKLMGGDATVTKEKDTFAKFVEGVKYQP